MNVGEPLDIDITDSEDAAASSSVLRPGCVPSMLCAHATSSCSASVVSPPAKGRPPEPCRLGSAMEIFRFNGGGLSMIRARGENGVADGGVCMTLRAGSGLAQSRSYDSRRRSERLTAPTGSSSLAEYTHTMCLVLGQEIASNRISEIW